MTTGAGGGQEENYLCKTQPLEIFLFIFKFKFFFCGIIIIMKKSFHTTHLLIIIISFDRKIAVVNWKK